MRSFWGAGVNAENQNDDQERFSGGKAKSESSFGMTLLWGGKKGKKAARIVVKGRSVFNMTGGEDGD